MRWSALVDSPTDQEVERLKNAVRRADVRLIFMNMAGWGAAGPALATGGVGADAQRVVVVDDRLPVADLELLIETLLLD